MRRQRKKTISANNPFVKAQYKVKELIRKDQIGRETSSISITRYELNSFQTRDVETFVKLYNIKSLNIILKNLPPICRRLFDLILTLLTEGSDTIKLDPEIAKEADIKNTAYYEAIKTLIEYGLIAKATTPLYYINLNFYFKGNRIKFIVDNYGEEHLYSI